MSRCTRCPVVTDLKRGLCGTCYSALRNKELAYGRWESELVPAADTFAHIDALTDAAMGHLQIRRLSAVPAATFSRLLRERPPQIGRLTAQRIAAVPVPQTVAALVASAQGHEVVPALGSTRRLRALVSAGWPMATMAYDLGMRRAGMDRLIHRSIRIRAYRHHEVVALFNRLQFEQGPSDDAAAYGLERMWPLPFEWDEDSIDEPGTKAAWARRHPREAA
ncbi:hypothetical protein [Nocardia vulneris]|uniref:Uncharacterized protein n=1 Tax=Nocardia vulneris TaxID=1141657 RepID=A0ABR4ZCJ9_9NOCA|nr:hypothetical protein [Nocardia vulneris]KIA63039.1 hypothetical protein FG87_22020 [Nocardia vulneris]